MSIHAMIAAAYLEGLEPSTRLVLMAVADSCDEQTRIAAPGLPKLRAWSGVSKSQVLRLIVKLEEAGLVAQTRKGNRGRRAEWQVFPNGVPAIPHPDEVAARFELSPPVDNPVELGSTDAPLLDEMGRMGPGVGSHPSDPFSTNPSVSSARAASTPVDRPASRPSSTGFPGARRPAPEDTPDPRTQRGHHDQPCPVADHGAKGEVSGGCGRCAHAAVNSDPAAVAQARAEARAATRAARQGVEVSRETPDAEEA